MVQLNGLMVFFLVTFVASSVAHAVLKALNIRHLRRHGGEVPEVFRGEIDGETLARISRYTLDTSRFGTAEGLCDEALTLAVLLGGLLPWLLGRLPAWEEHFILTGLLFFGILALSLVVSAIKLGKPILMHTIVLKVVAVLVYLLMILSTFFDTTIFVTVVLCFYTLGFIESILIFLLNKSVDPDSPTIFHVRPEPKRS